MLDTMNILLVEDNDIDVEILKRGLRKAGPAGELVRARDGLEALEILKEAPHTAALPKPFVVLLDINMPRMNGHEFLSELRAIPELKNVRVFVFTTSDNRKDIDLAYKNNASGYIVKPNSSMETLGVISALKSFWNVCEHPQI